MQTSIVKAVAALLLAGSVAGPAYAAGPGFPRSEKSFTYADGDKDGKLTMAEITARAEKRLFRLDQNADGSVGREEIETWLQKGLERRRDLMLADYDANRDGAITREELDAFVTAEFGKADKDGDGAVNLEESRAYRFVRAEDSNKQSEDDEE
jgi:Ca2+-binding EF-hand superfamily protein